MLSKELVDIYKKEEFAVEAFKEFRLRKGIHCKKCNGKDHYWLKSKKQFQCRACGFRTTLRSGTVIEGSKLPLSYFFITLHLLIKKGNSLTLEELQQYTDHKYYDPLWVLLRKLKTYVNENEQNTILIQFMEIINDYLLRKV